MKEDIIEIFKESGEEVLSSNYIIQCLYKKHRYVINKIWNLMDNGFLKAVNTDDAIILEIMDLNFELNTYYKRKIILDELGIT